MPFWGIVLIGVAAWVLVSVVLGALIGRAVKIADAHRRDELLTEQLRRRPAALGRHSLPTVHAADEAPVVPAPRASAH
ncbi:hypothetical protein [Naasia aerilata]|uniref:Uncharacterized protein n=1 Tax=Naasia aerilata TaxID=1162966 RepID=A0ABM8GCL9_9MICO|nr:hypothetical protein [Naasia aerilata]BDZ45962.1 hypothetical protein GCM10025866_18710 [Naasia aerilata]